MKVTVSGRIDSPSLPVLLGMVSFQGITTANGNAAGTTFVCAALANEPPYTGQSVKILSGPAAGQARVISVTGAGGVGTVGNAFTNSTGAAQQITAGTRFYILSSDGGVFIAISAAIANVLNNPAMPGLTETWQDVLGIDATVWATAVGAGGTVTRSVAEEPYQKVILAGAAAGDTARLRSVQQWTCGPDTFGANTFVQHMVHEWEGRIANVTEIDNATFFMGLSNIQLATRASTNIVGFILVGDALRTITDDGGAETVKVPAVVPNIALWHKYKIDITAGIIRFYIDGVLVATHTTAAAENLPDVNAYANYYVVQEAAGAGTGQLHVGPVSLRPQSFLV